MQHDTSPMALLERWFYSQFVKEYNLRYQFFKDTSSRRRWSPIYWPLDEELSLWQCIPEPMPKEWPRKPTVVSIKKKARDAWKIVNKTKLTCLKSKWDAPSTDHYYDRRYGCGTD